MKDQPATKSQTSRAEVCGKYAAVLNDYTVEEAIANYCFFDTGHKVDGDMLVIGNACNANKANKEKKHHDHRSTRPHLTPPPITVKPQPKTPKRAQICIKDTFDDPINIGTESAKRVVIRGNIGVWYLSPDQALSVAHAILCYVNEITGNRYAVGVIAQGEPTTAYMPDDAGQTSPGHPSPFVCTPSAPFSAEGAVINYGNSTSTIPAL